MRIGLMGCGAIAKAHAYALQRVGVEVVGVCDIDEERSARLAAGLGGVRRYRHATDLLERERPEVVHVVTPPQTHRDLTVEAMDAGSHVLVEKPMAMDVREADEMIEASRRNQRVLGVCHNQLFDPAVLEARELAASGRLGRIAAVETVYMFGGPDLARFSSTGWIQDLPGGIIHEVGPHLMYLQREFLGSITVASALTKSVPDLPPLAVEFRALLDGDSGSGSATISFAGRPRQAVLRIFGTEMSLRIDIRNHLLVRAHRDAAGGRVRRMLFNVDLGIRLATRAVTATVAGLRQPWPGSHANLIRCFYEALRDGRDPPVSAEDGRAVVAVLDQLWERSMPAGAHDFSR
jgi:2-alkyl-3-oxoalkanoate reductase